MSAELSEVSGISKEHNPISRSKSFKWYNLLKHGFFGNVDWSQPNGSRMASIIRAHLSILSFLLLLFNKLKNNYSVKFFDVNQTWNWAF